MSDIHVDPYLFFRGNCAEAMEFYKNAFGGELTIQKVGEVPTDFPGKDERKDEVMHAALRSDSITIFGADSPQASEKAAKIELSIGGSDEKRMKEMFDALSQGGKVKMKLEKQFWGDIFGQLTDKYNIDWMFNITAQK
jgi:PhnB protein